MKAPDFDYVRPDTLEEALRLLAADENVVPLAGGQSLIANLNQRSVAAPSMLVDIGRLAELKGISVEGECVRVGPLSRHVDLAQSPVLAEHVPLLCDALHHVAHAAVRNRGTIGGSLAHCGRAAELPACAVALDATILLADAAGRRAVPARRFFRESLTTDRRRGELITGILFPLRRPGQRHAFLELSRRHGDIALIGLVAVLQTLDGRIAEADLVYFGTSQAPLLSPSAQAALRGRRLPDDAFLDDAWVEAAVAADLDPAPAQGLRTDTKLKLAAVVTRRVLRDLRGKDGPGRPVPHAAAERAAAGRSDHAPRGPHP